MTKAASVLGAAFLLWLLRLDSVYALHRRGISPAVVHTVGTFLPAIVEAVVEADPARVPAVLLAARAIGHCPRTRATGTNWSTANAGNPAL